MKPQPNDTWKTARELHLSDEQSRDVTETITQADRLWRQRDNIELPDAVRTRVQSRLEQILQKRSSRRPRWTWVRTTTLVAAALLLGFVLRPLVLDTSAPSTTDIAADASVSPESIPTAADADEAAMWDFLLNNDDPVEPELDDMTMTEMVVFLNEDLS